MRVIDGGKDKRGKSAAARAPRPREGEPPMPKRVQDDTLAREKWVELVKLTTLPGARVLTIADGPMLELACLSYSRWLQAYDSGYWNRAEKHERAYERQLSHFGLSPAMRNKVDRVDEKGSGDPAERHFTHG